ncbi:hypothetical protein [Sphingobacterium bovisgrunnientis]|uniref:hypothetical protein n=1 Tax=Sphingobacterium bovisgrunnientis TaxID=1874697 RepID=UPI00135994FD|nr:hypothetical protein [Sphingobacterium bovisgrunnientis]
MEILIIIGIIALIFYGYFQAKKQDTILIDDAFLSQPNKNVIAGMDFGQGKDKTATAYYLNGLIMTPKQYGELHGNGKSRVKKSNRLKLRK